MECDVMLFSSVPALHPFFGGGGGVEKKAAQENQSALI
jgi:hypothetical protein